MAEPNICDGDPCTCGFMPRTDQLPRSRYMDAKQTPEYRKLWGMYVSMEQQRDAANNDNGAHVQRADEAEARFQEAQAKLDKMSRKASYRQTRITDLEAENSELAAALERAEADVQRYRNGCDVVEGKLKESQRIGSKLERDLIDAREALRQEKEECLSTAKVTAQQATQRAEELAERVNFLESELEQAKTDLGYTDLGREQYKEKVEHWTGVAAELTRDKGVALGERDNMARLAQNLGEMLAWMINCDFNPRGDVDV